MIMDVDKLEAGRELDALVERHVVRRGKVSWEGDEQQDSVDGCQPWVFIEGRHEDVPRYSTDIAAAWQVLLAVRDMPFSTRNEFTHILRRVVSLRIDASLSIHNSHLIFFIEPEDICLAALEVIEP